MTPLLLAAWNLCADAVFAQPTPAPTYRLIVHPENPATKVTRSVLADAFLKKVTRWPDGELIRPVDLHVESPVRLRFDEQVIGKSIAAVKSYWQQQIFSGRDVPPPELNSEVAVVEYVRTHRGALGYVSAAIDIGTCKQLSLE
ncbi:MAG: hypothetical protein HY791_27135 [Deltaproteobacteria bacterium]|nr:hypothetical protein [Deltaproteobacteria bacterium]